MKKMIYENVNEIRRNGCFTHNGFKTFENMMIGRVACSNRGKDGGEVTKFFDLVVFRDKTTGEFPFKDLFVGGKKVVFAGRFNTREYTDRDGNKRQADEIVVEEMHENVPREVEVPDDEAPKRAEKLQEPKEKPAKQHDGARVNDLPGDDAPLPEGFEENEVDF